MTTLEIILSILLYITLGLWICYKRDWYSSLVTDSQVTEFMDGFFINFIAVILMPINLIIIIFRELILRKWDNY